VAVAVTGCSFFEMHNDGGMDDVQPTGDFTASTAVGMPCADDSECQDLLGGTATCLMGSSQVDDVLYYYPDGYCTVACVAGGACPTGSVCYTASGPSYGFCAANCRTSADCRSPSYCCVESSATGDRFCAAPADPISYCSL
jgi:hypothetical protein